MWYNFTVKKLLVGTWKPTQHRNHCLLLRRRKKGKTVVFVSMHLSIYL